VPHRHLVLHLIESAIRPLWPAVRRELLGLAALGGIAGVAVGIERWQASRPPAIDPEESAAVRWLAPLVKRAPPPPRQEHLEFVGLGQVLAPAVPVSAPTAPRGDEQRPTPVSAAEAQGEKTLVAEESVTESMKPLTEIDVDSAAALDPTADGPVYPAAMLKLKIEGMVLARFIVDSTGQVDMTTFRVLQVTDPEFVAAVRAALPRMKYRPAVLAGRRVPQLVEQPFTFRIRP